MVAKGPRVQPTAPGYQSARLGVRSPPRGHRQASAGERRRGAGRAQPSHVCVSTPFPLAFRRPRPRPRPCPAPAPNQLTSLPSGPAPFQPRSGAPPHPNRPSTLNGFQPESFPRSDWPCWSPSRSSIGSRRPLSQALPSGGGGARAGGLRGSGWLRGGGGSSPRAVLGPELEALLTVA